MELTVSFSLARCDCGAERQVGQPCPRCGRGPGEKEVDEGLERRRAIVNAVRDREKITDAGPLALEDGLSVVGDWLGEFWSAYEATAEGSVEEAAAGLRQTLAALDLLHLRVARTPRLRPNHALWRAIDAVLLAYHDVRDTYLAALTSATMEEAERAAASGQEAIDAAAAALAEFNALAAAWQRIHDADLREEQADVLAGAEAVVDLANTTDVVDLDRKGAELFERIVDGAVECPAGLGVRLQTINLAVEASMDPARFWPIARGVYGVFARHATALGELFTDAEWRADLAGVAVELREAGLEAAAVGFLAWNRRLLIQSALRLAARQIERAAHPLLATLLAIEGRQPYASKRRRDIGDLLKQTAQAGHDDLLVGLDPKLRDADAHGKFRIDDGGVRLTGTRGKLDYLSDDELVDVTFAGTESITAVYFGLIAALVAANVDVEELEKLAIVDVADADRIVLVLALSGWHDVEVDIDNSAIVARGVRDKPNSPSLFGAVAAVSPADCETLTLVASDEAGVHTAQMPLAPHRRMSRADGKSERQIAFITAAMASKIDGAPILTRAHAEKVHALAVMEALQSDIPAREALPALRARLDAARELGLDELAEAIALALRLRREVATGTGVTVSPETVVSALEPFALLEVPPIPSSW
jgi:hypothetical protein